MLFDSGSGGLAVFVFNVKSFENNGSKTKNDDCFRNGKRAYVSVISLIYSHKDSKNYSF